MNLTNSEIQQFTSAISQQQAPSWDPGFQITKALLAAVAKLTDQLRIAEAQISLLRTSERAEDAVLLDTMLGALLPVQASTVTPEEYQALKQSLEQTVKAAQTGAQIIPIAGDILRLVAAVVVAA